MEGKKIFINLDILGYEKLADEIAKEKGIDDRDVRKKFKEVINRIVENLSEKNEILGYFFGKDDWILIVDDFNRMFKVIYIICEHDTGYPDYKKIGRA
ncbi:MAG: hypothetical protein HWN66_16720, partial [Candidatus Helarchaeota archaeon]|nr:hypothetical protein [Candidatus Helarchaeota archaeon]